MVVWSTDNGLCPSCLKKISVREVGSGFSLGQDSDLLVQMKGKHIIQAEIHGCRTCRFSGLSKAFMSPPKYSKAQRRRWYKKIVPEIMREYEERPLRGADYQHWGPNVSYPLQYEYAARGNEHFNSDPAGTAELYLRAYWCLRLHPHKGPEDTPSMAEHYLGSVIKILRANAKGIKNPTWMYLLGELSRRKGNFKHAELYFKKFLEMRYGEGVDYPYLRNAAEKLLILVREESSVHRSMEDLLYTSSDKPAEKPNEKT